MRHSPLAGVRVLDVTHALAGPYCSMLLADLGADVVKIERPEAPELVAEESIGLSDPFHIANRNKRSLAVDLKNPAGSALVRRLAKDADIFVQNFRPGVLDRMGLGPEHLFSDHPELVYVVVSGFGQTGPYQRRAGLDLVAQGMSGLMSFNGESGRPPTKAGVPLADLNAGCFSAIGALAAYQHRLKTGEGQVVDVALLDSVLAYTVWETDQWFSKGVIAQPLGSAHRAAAPYEAFPTSDGWLNIGAANQRLWEKLLTVLDAASLSEDERFATNELRVEHRPALAAVLSPMFATMTTAHWLQVLDAAGIPCGPVYTIDEVWADPHIRSREMAVDFKDDQGSFTYIGSPIKLERTPVSIVRRAPRVGEHTRAVLRDWGVSDSEVESLIVDKAIHQTTNGRASQ